MLKRLWVISSLVLFSYTLSYAHGHASQPVDVLKKISATLDQKILVAEQKKGITPDFFKVLVRTVFLPNIDVEVMSQQILGHRVWLRATQKERAEFVHLFAQLIVQSYAHVAEHYTGHKIFFRRAAPVGATQRFSEVRSVLVLPDGHHVIVNYLCVRVEGSWKVYDFTVDGVSFVDNYRAQFSELVNKGGMQDLLKKLRRHTEKKSV